MDSQSHENGKAEMVHYSTSLFLEKGGGGGGVKLPSKM